MKSRCVNYRLLIAGMNIYALSGLTGLYNFGRGWEQWIKPLPNIGHGEEGAGEEEGKTSAIRVG